ncbi:Glycogen debranching enzyme [Alkalibacterium sp. AK22]|uniref:type I pullulanase n=1 Tax=Alkalibacterium sp. AK22 TaxID=1229520 RepID=UPI00044F9412|nr:type I pullulanase [Alkalibacterium sp. AK22]EXJ23021.1 Glycogen debranching enzyme [Alkalibacterium sp. AK22]
MDIKQPLELRIPYLEDRLYEKNDLGLNYHQNYSTFKVWSPLAKEAWLCLYDSADALDPVRKLRMTARENVWSIKVSDDLNGYFYTYVFVHDKKEVETADLYSTAVGLNGDRSAIINLSDTDPEGWQEDYFDQVDAITEAIIYEVHVEDFSSDEAADFNPDFRGKYLAFTETGVTVEGVSDQPAGLDYLTDLGINYVHVLPAFDYQNDEESNAYNWGYDPKNYMVPEGKYATDPADPTARIREFKAMVASLHARGIGVILDVVYNHTFDLGRSAFQKTVPDYYYRQNQDGSPANGSGCGNETASERRMMRKYIIDSLMYWIEEYHIDGIRFDLMGLHDVQTMNLLRETLNANGHEKVLIYGEPWNAGSVAIFEPNKPADKYHVGELADGIAIFNDEFRDAIKGPVFDAGQGAFLQGANGREGSAYSNSDLIASILANTQQHVGRFSLPQEKNWARTPAQVVTYASAHDNLTLYDKLVASRTDRSSYGRNVELIQLNKINAALLFTSLGGTFFQAGEEFARTKAGDENSYRSSININQLDWRRAYDNKDLRNYYKGMIQIRRHYRPLQDRTNKTGDNITFSQLRENVIAYTIPNTSGEGDWSIMAVIANTSDHSDWVELKSSFPLPDEWTILANRHTAGTRSLGTVIGNLLLINSKEVLVLVA